MPARDVPSLTALLYCTVQFSITLDDVKEFARTVLTESAIEGTACGNLDPKALRATLEGVLATVSSETLPRDRQSRLF